MHVGGLGTGLEGGKAVGLAGRVFSNAGGVQGSRVQGQGSGQQGARPWLASRLEAG